MKTIKFILLFTVLSFALVSCSDDEKFSVKYVSEREILNAAENAAFVYAAGNNTQIIEEKTEIYDNVDGYHVYKVRVYFVEYGDITVYVTADAKRTQLFDFNSGMFEQYKK